jgi:hypothetical protein
LTGWIGKAQDVIKGQKPVEVSDVTRSEAIKTGLKSLSGQARRIVERVKQASSRDQGTREGREREARSAAEGIRVDDSRTAREGRSGYQGEAAREVRPDVSAASAFTSAADAAGITKEKRGKYAPKINRDRLTGWFTNSDRAKTVARAQQWSDEYGLPSTYVVMDISNLGGLNEGLGQHSADVVFRSMAYIMLKHANGLNADVIPFRHGGDEISFVILGANNKPER